jgi:magnesium chelatase accessory protein
LAWRAADRAAVQRLIGSTGSVLDDEGVEWYARLVREPSHIGGALGMMAHWDLTALEQALDQLEVPVALVAGRRDGTVSPAEATIVQRRLPDAEVHFLDACGHLAHEESPDEVAQLVIDFAHRRGALAADVGKSRRPAQR